MARPQQMRTGATIGDASTPRPSTPRALSVHTGSFLLPLALGAASISLLTGCVTRIAPQSDFARPKTLVTRPMPAGPQNDADETSRRQHVADPERAPEPSAAGTIEPGEPIAWPETWRQSGPGPRGVVVEIDEPRTHHGARWLGEHHQLITGPVEREDAAALASAVGVTSGFSFRPEGPGSFVFVELEDRFRPPPAASDPTRSFRHVQGVVVDEHAGVERIAIERTWFDFSPPPAGRAAKGVVVLLPGLFGTPEAVIDRVERTIRSDGWGVLRAWSLPARFTERLRVEVKPGAEEVAAEELATQLTERAAAAAYAVEATTTRLLELEPDYAGKPVVLLGMSGGAISLSTVHARSPGLYDGAVLIAGGVNFLGINLFSDYAPWVEALTLDWTPGVGDEGTTGPPPTREAGERLAALYLDRAPLDGYHLAPLLRGKPTLIIHGSADDAVPAAFGDQLYERAGRPERWVLPFGHEALFLMLPIQANRIVRWLDESFAGEADPASEGDG